MDIISKLVGRHTFSATAFYNGEFCGSNELLQDEESGVLHLVRSGTAIFNHDDDTSLHIDSPSLLFYPSGLKHRLVVPTGASADLFCAKTIFEGGSQNLLVKTLPPLLRIPLAQAPTLKQTLNLLFCEAASDEQGHQLILDGLCRVLISQILRHELKNGSVMHGTLAGLSDTRLSKAIAAIHEIPQEKWGLESLARLCGMSRSSFAERFHQVVGTTPALYLSQWRVGLAKSMLKDGKPLKSVSHELGYSSESVFTRVFTAQTGMSPIVWLKGK